MVGNGFYFTVTIIQYLCLSYMLLYEKCHILIVQSRTLVEYKHYVLYACIFR